MGTIFLRKGEEQDIRSGSLWVYDNEIERRDDCADGGVVEITDYRGHFLARGYYNSRSKITARVLTRDPEETIDVDFLRRRLLAAWQFRQKLGFADSCRVVFGESDGLPGLTVDKFADCLSLQTLALGIDVWKPQLIELLAELFRPRGIYERNDVPIREKEGLEQRKGCVYGEVPPLVTIREHDAQMLVDIANGQKTGHFLDQQENRGRLRPYCRDRSVLDLCCCSGGFAIHAALYGARTVTAVDASAEALALTERNAALNGVGGLTVTCANVFDLLHDYCDAGRRFGVVVLDPPAFAKHKRSLDAAYRGYKELNLRAMRLTEPGGYLLTFSCSQFMTPELFHAMLCDAAADVGRPVRQLEVLTQSRDHPAALNAEQSRYLKGEILQIE